MLIFLLIATLVVLFLLGFYLGYEVGNYRGYAEGLDYGKKSLERYHAYMSDLIAKGKPD